MSFEPCWSNYFCCSFPSLLPNMLSDEEKSTHFATTQQNAHTASRETSTITSSSCCSSFSEFNELLFSFPSLLLGNAFDLVVTQSTRDPSLVACSDAFFCFDRGSNGGFRIATPHAQNVILEVDSISGKSLRFPIKNKKIQMPEDILYPMEERREKKHWPCNTTAENESHSLLALQTIATSLNVGRNRARYLLLHEEDIVAMAPINIFLWTEQDRIIVVDIDGTITKSNFRGVVDTILTSQYQHCHVGVCKFFFSLLQVRRQFNHQTRIVYLSSRPITIANTTRKFLSELRQHEETQLPHGPLIGFPGTLAQVLMMELVTHSVHEFKSNALREQVVLPFTAIGVTSHSVLVAGFGNTQMDLQAYHRAGCEKIYLIDKYSKIYSLDPHPPSVSKSHHRHRHSTSCRNNCGRIRGSLFDGYSDNNLFVHVSQSAVVTSSIVSAPDEF